MLNHLRKRISNLLASVDTATLATAGPAGVQARSYPCQSLGIFLYLLLPATADHLLNLEHDEAVLISTPGWQLRGRGKVLPVAAGPADLSLGDLPAAKGCYLLKVWPAQLQVYSQNGWGFSETLDIEPDSLNLT